MVKVQSSLLQSTQKQTTHKANITRGKFVQGLVKQKLVEYLVYAMYVIVNFQSKITYFFFFLNKLGTDREDDIL